MRAVQAGQSALLFVDVAEILTRENIDYLIIGAFALAIHGSVRATSDVDALLYVSFPRLTEISKIFQVAGFGVTMRRGDEDDPILSMLVLSDLHGNRVELLGGLRGLDPLVFARAVEVPFYGVNLRIASREDFIAMKCFAGSAQDLADARAAIDASQSTVDLDLLRAVTRRFGRAAADRLEHLLA
jgi:predicted nucleotidyltransferase